MTTNNDIVIETDFIDSNDMTCPHCGDFMQADQDCLSCEQAMENGEYYDYPVK